MIALDKGHAPALVGQLLGQRVAGLPGTDHDGVVVWHILLAIQHRHLLDAELLAVLAGAA